MAILVYQRVSLSIHSKNPSPAAPAPKTELAHHSYLCYAWNIHRLTKPRCCIQNADFQGPGQPGCFQSHHRCDSTQKAWDDVVYVFVWCFLLGKLKFEVFAVKD